MKRVLFALSSLAAMLLASGAFFNVR